WAGVDGRTQRVRALVVDTDGVVAGAGTAPLTSSRDGVRHEQDPAAWWTAVRAALRAALRDADASRVRGVAVDATSGTILLADGTGTPISPALMYDDARAGAEAERVDEAGAALWTRLGYRRMQPSWALPKLLWLLREHGRAGARLVHQADYVTARLAGHPVAADSSHALKTGYDLVDERWPGDVLDALGVPADVLPDVVRPGTGLGTVSAEAAAETGLPEGAAVVAGMTDGCAAQLGAGALQVGAWNSVLGTTLVLKGVTKELLADPTGVVYSHRSPDGGWLPGGASSTGAGVLTRLFPGRDLAALDAAAAQHEPASVVVYPLVSRGERFPFVAPEAEPFVCGRPAGEADHYAAVLQGVAFVERLCFDHLDRLGAPVDGPLSLTGGATRSRYWCQLRADVLGRPVRLPDNAEPALGMAVLAAASGGSVAEAAGRMVRVRETLDPRPGAAGRFAAAYLRLVDELAGRGWLDLAMAAYARERAEVDR
ncbi:MAG TPA: FGGY family carbohydrate kinase, partial [Streptosporangiales bacterium]